MARKLTGQLIERASGFYARVTTTIDGERVRVMKALGTKNRTVAKRKLARLLATESPKTEDVQRPETFAEACERVYQARIAEAEGRAVGQRRDELAQLQRYAVPSIGPMPVTAVAAADVNGVLDAAKRAGLARQTVDHIRVRISGVFRELRREGAIKVNPVDDSEMPRFAETVVRERAVLTDHELAVYLGWEHPTPHFQMPVRERQTMACVARLFGGLRAGDLHALRWESLDAEHGAFEWGYAPRAKTKRPQLLEVPEMLRPILRDWWERHGRPREGFVFPVTRIGKRGDRVGEKRERANHASALRRDLQRAFRAAAAAGVAAPKEGSQRWRELFAEGQYTRPVDWHSWRRSYVQALADADVNAQTAQALAGHADLASHARYLRNAGKMRKLPEAALPAISIKAIAKGTATVSPRLTLPAALTVDAETDAITHSETPIAETSRRPSNGESAVISQGHASESAPALPFLERLRGRQYEAPAVVAVLHGADLGALRRLARVAVGAP